MDLSVVVPTYRGAAMLPRLVARVAATCGDLGLSWEVVVVNDSSPDDTWQVLVDLHDEYEGRVVGVDLFHNHGQAVATMCGLAHARGEVVATMDDDLQHPPEELASLWRTLDERPDLDAVVGDWPRDQGPLRDLGSWLHGWSDRLANGTPVGFRHSAFRMLRRGVVDAMLAHGTRTPVVGPLLVQTTDRVANVTVEHAPRLVGASTFRTRHGLAAVAANVTKGTTLPLRLMSAFGVVASALSALVAAALLVRWGTGAATAPGWLSVFLATVFFGGVLLVQVGLLSEYVHLVITEVRRPPRWDVRSITGAVVSGPVRLSAHDGAGDRTS